MRMMKVLMVTPSFYPSTGGTETMVQNLSKELKKVGLDIDILTFNMDEKWCPKWNGKIEKVDGLKVIKIPALNWLPFVHSPRINFRVDLIPGLFTSLMKEYDIIHFHEAEFSFPLFSFFVKKPKILHLHELRFDYFKRYHFSRFMLKHSSNLCFALTKQMKKELMLLGLPENKIVHFPNSVDSDVFHPNGKRQANTLLYVGRLVPQKGLHVLISSLKYVNMPVTLQIIGPQGWNQKYNDEIMALIENENQKRYHKIQYLGTVDHNQLIESYQKASIFVSSSNFEPFGVVILEAMACAAPVISTCTDGAVEFIENGQNGILVPINDHKQMSQAINSLLENESLRNKLGIAGRKTVVEKYSIMGSIQKLCNIYKKMLQNIN
jgi:glycosyltransferase involved in cell wall biosynthesis